MSKPTEQVMQAVRERSKDNRISCAVARKIGTDLGVPMGMVGDACNELKVKIYACELGCFQ